jgi:hypothetical protein
MKASLNVKVKGVICFSCNYFLVERVFGFARMRQVFTLGKQLQQHRDEYQDVSHEIVILEHVMQEMQHTFLSPLVHTILSTNPEDLKRNIATDEREYITESRTLRWSSFTRSQMCSQQSYPDQPEVEVFLDASVFLRRVLVDHIHPFMLKTLKSEPIDKILALYRENMKILPKLSVPPQQLIHFDDHVVNVDNGLFLELWDLYVEGEFSLCCHIGVTNLERSIGDMVSGHLNWPPTKMLKLNGNPFMIHSYTL